MEFVLSLHRTNRDPGKLFFSLDRGRILLGCFQRWSFYKFKNLFVGWFGFFFSKLIYRTNFNFCPLAGIGQCAGDPSALECTKVIPTVNLLVFSYRPSRGQCRSESQRALRRSAPNAEASVAGAPLVETRCETG